MNLMTSSWKATGVEDHELAAQCRSTVLITALSAGQVEKLARSIHGAGVLASYPFVRVHVGALPCDLATLKNSCAQLFTAAAGGTLLLANVEETSTPAQEYLVNHLEALQNRGTAAAVRVVAGTTVSVIDRIASGAFSEELFYRLNTIHLAVADSPLNLFCDDDGRRERSRPLAAPDRVVL